MDITPAQIKVHNLDIACWTLLEDHQVRFFNLGTINNPQKIKPKAMLDESITKNIKAMLQEYKDIFAWNYIDLKGIPSRIAQHHIELNTTIPHVRQVRYWVDPNYDVVIKQDLDKLLSVGFIAQVEEAN